MCSTYEFSHLTEKLTDGNKSGFLDSIAVWVNKPHVVNRRLCGTCITKFSYVDKDSIKVPEYLQKTCLPTQQIDETGTETSLLEIENLNDIPKNEIAIIERKLIYKNSKIANTTEIIVIEDADNQVTASFYVFTEDKELDNSSYQLVFISDPDLANRIQLKKISIGQSHDESSLFDWLSSVLLPKLCNWSAESKLKTAVTSLRQLPIEEYSEEYARLKETYGKYFVQNWPESTDPQKFVYEDVAIATYLLVLWKLEREKKKLDRKQSFVDLGCGNGLLVHILSSEGHPGVGLDIRKRKIWDMYGASTVLKEVTVTPSAENTFPEYDWLIGNHSDELTPWIPVIAARSSFTCRYFVLPCCHYDFDCKFSSKQPGLSNYRTYLNFVKEVGEVCGFNVEEDTLRIPSTKRVCFIGQERSYSECDEAEIDSRRTVYIQSRSKSRTGSQGNDIQDSGSAKYQKLENGQKWSADFEPREQSKEKSRNCQHIDKSTKELIINTVFRKVLESDFEEIRNLPDGRTWRKGGTVPLGEVVKLFDKEVLKHLKSECGGLQTLLKNHNNIFCVSGGQVQLRDLSLEEPYSKKSQLSRKDKSQYFKTLPCWFYTNHPDGCPRTDVTCTFAHGDLDIKPKNRSEVT